MRILPPLQTKLSVGDFGFRQEVVKPLWSPRPRRVVLRVPSDNVQVTDLAIALPGLNLETASFLKGLSYRDENGDITTEATEIPRIMRDYYE